MKRILAVLALALSSSLFVAPADASVPPAGGCTHNTYLYDGWNGRWAYRAHGYWQGRHYHSWVHQYWNGSYWQSKHTDTVWC